ncbi:MAG: NADPH dehydrogenase, partial [Paenisporosarcina sp.]
KWMKEQGVDLVDVSSGANVPATIDSYPGYQVKFSETIKHDTPIATGAVGMITSPLQAEEILKNDRADLIFLARELLRDPYWAYRAAKELRTEIKSPVQYERGWL